ncbi:prepilin-type N-terminal cleavage/methylation domain-containing protein [Rhodoferax saidenbachensis]|uniref:Prepilin-type N-terminal cleavage/methylation domain-containing protein n=1 Tax=Rhodoferax saidenbachensis TaxID=1484693 RepID=A0A1P8K5K2_9BURK|nr:prepilin-type N-terminal cleavage/methylation domain-containing protein [Rhodoferax saidenbachensis]APW41277.1 prepilin-type N-terminal cleavage/methylation domain-containing protein [Rhodoferax saidenbachensis]
MGGFTLIELIMVLVLLGVLAVVAAPRMFNGNDFEARGFHDQTLSYLRYAQKTAIAQRRTVCVTFTNNSLTLSIASAEATLDCTASATPFFGPGRDGSATLNVKPGSGVIYSSTPAALNYNGLGQPTTSAGVALTTARNLQVVGVANAITVEAGTGYVHE